MGKRAPCSLAPRVGSQPWCQGILGRGYLAAPLEQSVCVGGAASLGWAVDRFQVQAGPALVQGGEGADRLVLFPQGGPLTARCCKEGARVETLSPERTMTNWRPSSEERLHPGPCTGLPGFKCSLMPQFPLLGTQGWPTSLFVCFHRMALVVLRCL